MDSSLNFLLSPRILERLFFTRVVLGQISNTRYPIEFSHLNNTTDVGLRLASLMGQHEAPAHCHGEPRKSLSGGGHSGS